MKSKPVPKGNDPVPQNIPGLDEPTMMVDLYRMFEGKIDGTDKFLDSMSKLTDLLRSTNQRVARLQHGAQQPRLTKEADAEPYTETRKRTEDAACSRSSEDRGYLFYEGR